MSIGNARLHQFLHSWYIETCNVKTIGKFNIDEMDFSHFTSAKNSTMLRVVNSRNPNGSKHQNEKNE
jgi:hypothetical protein